MIRRGWLAVGRPDSAELAEKRGRKGREGKGRDLEAAAIIEKMGGEDFSVD